MALQIFTNWRIRYLPYDDRDASSTVDMARESAHFITGCRRVPSSLVEPRRRLKDRFGDRYANLRQRASAVIQYAEGPSQTGDVSSLNLTEGFAPRSFFEIAS